MAKWNEQQFIDQNRGEFVHEENLKNTVEEQDKRDSGQDTNISNNKTEADANKEKNVEQDADLATLKKEADANRDKNTAQDSEIKANKDANTQEDGEINQLNTQLQRIQQLLTGLAAALGTGGRTDKVTITKFNNVDLTSTANGTAAATLLTQPMIDIPLPPNNHVLAIKEFRGEVNVPVSRSASLINTDGSMTMTLGQPIIDVELTTNVPAKLYVTDGTHAMSCVTTITVDAPSDGTQVLTLKPMMDSIGQPTQFATFLAGNFAGSANVSLQVDMQWYHNSIKPLSPNTGSNTNNATGGDK